MKRGDLPVLPIAPGCYLFHAADGRVLYVGKAVNLRSRVSSYFGGNVGEIAFTLGAADDRAQASALVERFRSLDAVHAALDETRAFWREITRRLTVETPDPAINQLANGWLQYQAVAGRLLGRTAYYQTGGAYGFRDQLQDSLVWLLLARNVLGVLLVLTALYGFGAYHRRPPSTATTCCGCRSC